MIKYMVKYVLAVVMVALSGVWASAHLPSGRLVEVGDGYAATSVNTAVFRGSSLATHGDTQYISYYDPDGHVVLGKRKLGSDNWTIQKTQYKGNIKDAHNVISLGVDGDGYLHASFDHHGHS